MTMRRYEDNLFVDAFGSFAGGVSGFIVGVAVPAILLVAACTAFFGPRECEAHWSKTAHAYDWTFHGGCMVNLNGTWVREKYVVPSMWDGKVAYIAQPETKK
jgi:hypothetical protein